MLEIVATSLTLHESEMWQICDCAWIINGVKSLTLPESEIGPNTWCKISDSAWEIGQRSEKWATYEGAKPLNLPAPDVDTGTSTYQACICVMNSNNNCHTALYGINCKYSSKFSPYFKQMSYCTLRKIKNSNSLRANTNLASKKWHGGVQRRGRK